MMVAMRGEERRRREMRRRDIGSTAQPRSVLLLILGTWGSDHGYGAEVRTLLLGMLQVTCAFVPPENYR